MRKEGVSLVAGPGAAPVNRRASARWLRIAKMHALGHAGGVQEWRQPLLPQELAPIPPMGNIYRSLLLILAA